MSKAEKFQVEAKLPLLRFPNELLIYIISFLDTESSFELSLNQQPRESIVDNSTNQYPLKQISLVSHRVRNLVLPILFRHLRLDPYQLTELLEFFQKNTLNQYIVSIVAYLQGPCSHIHPAWWVRLLNQVPATIFAVVCAPHIFSELAGINMIGVDSWAFNMPRQILRLEQSSQAAIDHIPYNKIPNILVARPWTSLTVNEGSSLKAYTTYEYFLRKTPSLLAGLLHSRSVEANHLFASLTKFSFVGIFPFYNHVDEILKCVRKMISLKQLFIKLCPEPDSNVLSDEIDDAQGHIDVNDPWNEFDTSVALVAHTVIFLTVEGCLEDLHMDDVKMQGIRDSLEESVTSRLQEWWLYRGGGHWRKKELSS